MRNRPLIAASGGIIILLGIVAVITLSRLPAHTQLPIHWNAASEADRFANASVALFMPAILTAGLSALFIVLPQIEPLQDKMAGSAVLLDTCWAGLLALITLTEVTIAAPAFGLALPPTLHLVALGISLIAIGNALPKSRPGFFVGIRTPWALSDTDNWIATHRLGSRTAIAGGAMIVLAGFLPIAAEARAMVVRLALAIMIVPPVAYSWWLWHRSRTEA